MYCLINKQVNKMSIKIAFGTNKRLLICFFKFFHFAFTFTLAHLCFFPYPRWPQDFRWSSNGTLRNYHCVQINKTAGRHSWRDNYFCSSSSRRNPGMKWSSHNPIPGMKCTNITELADPDTWNDNYLCLPSNSTLNFQWSSNGTIPGMSCIRWLETADPHSWNNSYLCGMLQLIVFP